MIPSPAPSHSLNPKIKPTLSAGSNSDLYFEGKYVFIRSYAGNSSPRPGRPDGWLSVPNQKRSGRLWAGAGRVMMRGRGM
ncbi:hypothetical protein V5O48_016924, partial [Marasmius crinis-equi]